MGRLTGNGDYRVGNAYVIGSEMAEGYDPPSGSLSPPPTQIVDQPPPMDGVAQVSRLFITIGLPASGKTTRARAWTAEEPLRRVRLNRDDLRDMMVGGWTGQAEHENAVTATQHAAVRALLVAGYDVVVDDTNFHREHVQALTKVGLACGADVGVWDMTNVPVETCIERDAARAAVSERAVGEQVIRSMHERSLQRLAAVGELSG